MTTRITNEQESALIKLARDNRESELIKALIFVTRQGGNQSDENLMTRTGPNDAAQRGIMYVNAREIAVDALLDFIGAGGCGNEQ